MVKFGEAVEKYRKEQKIAVGEDLLDQYNAAIDAPWQANDFPLIKSWVDINQKPMEIVLEGTRQPHYFRPIVKTTEEEPLLATLIPDIQQMRELARFLSVRSMLAISEERFDDASRDSIALHRLARHVGEGATIIESLVGVAIDFVARNVDLKLANAESITVEQLKAHQHKLSELPTLAHFDQALKTEHMVNLDAVQMIATMNMKSDQGKTTLSLMGLDLSSTMGQMMATLFQNSVDWNVVFVGINDYHSKVKEAMSQESFAKRHTAIKELSEEIQTEAEQANRPTALTLAALFSPQRRANHMRLILVSLLAPALEQVAVAETRGNSNAPLTETAFAVATYQKREGSLPERLEQLVPEDLAAIPLDPFTGQPVKYIVKKDEARIYVTVKDLEDNQGVSEFELGEAHDIVVQVKKQQPEN